MIDLTKAVYNKCVDYVKELWNWVTGFFGSDAQKKQKRQQENQMKKDEEKLNRVIEASEQQTES